MSETLKIALILILFFPFNFLKSQISDLPKIDRYHTHLGEVETKHPRENSYWENGNLKIDYAMDADSIISRNEYFPNGSLKFIIEINFGFSEDTIVKYDELTDTYEVLAVKTPMDIYHGKYTEYYNSSNLIQRKTKLIGYYRDFRKVGEWNLFDRKTNNKTVLNFNNHDEIEGDYFEYYYIKVDSTYRIKIEGKFENIEYENIRQTYRGTQFSKYNKKESRRSGTWKYYRIDGVLMEEVEYKWIQNKKRR